MSGTESRIGREEGLKMRTSQPRRWRMREASKAISLLYERFRKLPYKTKTLSLDPVFARSASAILIAVSSSSSEIQSFSSSSGERRKGRYFALISGSSSLSEMASWGA